MRLSDVGVPAARSRAKMEKWGRRQRTREGEEPAGAMASGRNRSERRFQDRGVQLKAGGRNPCVAGEQP